MPMFFPRCTKSHLYDRHAAHGVDVRRPHVVRPRGAALQRLQRGRELAINGAQPGGLFFQLGHALVGGSLLQAPVGGGVRIVAVQNLRKETVVVIRLIGSLYCDRIEASTM